MKNLEEKEKLEFYDGGGIVFMPFIYFCTFKNKKEVLI